MPVITREKKRVLVVDDEDALTALCGMLLERTGHFSVRTECEGMNAMAAAREFRPDLIFLDCCLPDKDGAEIAAELQADGELCSVPVIFLTGGLTREESEAINAQGEKETMAKPFEGQAFLQRALELVEGVDRLVA